MLPLDFAMTELSRLIADHALVTREYRQGNITLEECRVKLNMIEDAERDVRASIEDQLGI